jgi:cell cycle checkpoint protein
MLPAALMAPPAKRQKRNVIPSSSPACDHEEDEFENAGVTPKSSHSISSPQPMNNTSPPVFKNATLKTPLTPSKAKPRAKTANHPANAAALHLPSRARPRTAGSKSASSSPEKAKAKAKISEKGKSGDLLKLFSSQIQRQQTTNGTSMGNTRAGSHTEIKNEEDDSAISEDDDDVGDRIAQASSLVGAAAKKRSHGSTFGDMDLVSSSQKFLRKPMMKFDTQKEEDMRPWAERFAPVNLEELAVHKKKVADVRGWLESVMDGQVRQRLLVLKGAAGTGKTTAVQLLAKAMDCEILEWRNPVGSVASSDGSVSMAAQFEEFIGRGGRFGQLDIFSEALPASSNLDTKPLDRRKSWILVEEFPNTFTRSSTALQSFRSSVLQYLASNTPSLSMMYNKSTTKGPVTPLIMVISETLLTTSTASADSFTAHRLLGPEILQHPGVTVIEFNAIAPTLLAKALELVVVKESRKSGRRRTPGPMVLKRLGEIGDIRSAIGSLEFLCVRGDDGGDWGGKVSFGKGKKSAKDSIPMTKMEQESLELVTRREASLGIFHAVGKVVYNKRDDIQPVSSDENSAENLPSYLSNKARPRKSQVSVDELIDETGTDTQTFVAALHENYILSCDASPGNNDFSDMDHVNGCIDALSDSDLVCPSWDGSFNFPSFRGGSSGDILRQDELCFQIAVRGILFSLPYPVKRRAPAAGGLRAGRGGDAFKMFYPTSLKLWRMKEEIESTIDLWLTKLMKGEDYIGGGITAGAAAFAKLKPGSVETWRSSRDLGNATETKNPAQDDDTSPLLGIGTSAKKEMLIERLPYMALIAKARRVGGTSAAIRDMEKVTTFTGIGGPSEDVTDEGEDGLATEEWATDKPIEGESPRKKAASNNRWKRRNGQSGNGLDPRFAEQKLVLSDDDIEDF